MIEVGAGLQLIVTRRRNVSQCPVLTKHNMFYPDSPRKMNVHNLEPRSLQREGFQVSTTWQSRAVLTDATQTSLDVAEF